MKSVVGWGLGSLIAALFLINNTLHASTATGQPAAPLSVSQLIEQHDALADKTLTVNGLAIWVCPHRGCKAQLADPDAPARKLLVAQGAAPKFDLSLRGDTLRVTGTLRVRRVTPADLDAREAALRQPAAAHAHADDCADCPEKKAIAADPEKAAAARKQELAQIAKQRALLAKNKTPHLTYLTLEAATWSVQK